MKPSTPKTSYKKSKLFYPLRVIAQLFRLPNYVEFFETKIKYHSDENAVIRADISSINEKLVAINETISILPSIDARVVSLQHRMETQKSSPTSKANTESVNNTVSDNHEFDYFYKLFEDKFRGTEEAIKTRIAEHLPLFLELPDKIKNLLIVDIGCGRGEFLGLMKDSKLNAIGIDMNESMVKRAKNLGYKAELNDALTYLKNQKTSSIAAVTGFHIVEHIPFESLLKIFEECYRTVASGGFVLFETPNPHALTVGADTFYLDPSHQRPIPQALLSFMLESVGFSPRIIPLHRVRPELKHDDKVVVDLYESLYGAGDYAVIARKS